MNLFIWLVVGGLVGWAASMLMGGGGQGILINVIVGIVGAFIGGYFFGPMMGSTINDGNFSLPSLLVSLLGAVLLLFVLRLIRRV
jgi:uncharacterized membrane protein YeaQ/YmgE (transglycosylase-associated protein family)